MAKYRITYKDRHGKKRGVTRIIPKRYADNIKTRKGVVDWLIANNRLGPAEYNNLVSIKKE